MADLAGLTQLVIGARDEAERAGVLLDGLQFAVFEPNDAAPWTIAQFLPDACFAGDAVRAPDSIADCLWVQETLWTSPVPRTIDLELEITGDHDMRVEVEASNGSRDVFSILAAPALPQFRKIAERFEDVVAVHLQGRKSPVNACSALRFRYRLCYPRRFGLTV
jgi:hypothetical protein